MSTKIRRNYSMPDGELIQFSDDLLDSLTRDLPDLGEYGITPAVIAAIHSKREAFSNFKTDPELSGALCVATADKRTKRKELRKTIREIVLRMEICFDENHKVFVFCEASNTSTMSDHELVRCARRVSQQATENLAVLASVGLTSAIITALDILGLALDEAIYVQDKAIRNRDLSVYYRVTLGNELYEELLKMANLGKGVYGDINEAKYNDYVIYKTKKQGETVSGNIAPQAIVTLSLSIDEEDDLVTIENIGTSELIAYFAPGPTDPPGRLFINVAAGKDVVVSVKEIGFNKTNATRFNIKNIGETIGKYLVRMES